MDSPFLILEKFVPPFVSTLFVTLWDGAPHAYNLEDVSEECGFKEDQLGYYHTPVSLHFHHHLSLTLNLMGPGSCFFAEHAKRDHEILEQLNKKTIAEMEPRWKRKMGFKEE